MRLVSVMRPPDGWRPTRRSVAFVVLALWHLAVGPYVHATAVPEHGAFTQWIVTKENGKIEVRSDATRAPMTFFSDVHTARVVSRFNVVSVVGSVLSVSEQSSWQGGAHPGHLRRLRTINLVSGRTPVPLTDMFPEAAIVAALLKDGVVTQALARAPQRAHPKTLKDISQTAEGGCEMDFSELGTRYAFHHVKGDQVAVRLGLPHGCEAMRGDHTEIGIYLPIPAPWRGAFERAQTQRTLQQHLPQYGSFKRNS
jgi:hypothetical protein